MKVVVNGYNKVTSKKDGKQYTFVDGLSDMTFSNGKGFQNIQVILSGHRDDLVIGKTYNTKEQTFKQGDQLVVRIVDLI